VQAVQRTGAPQTSGVGGLELLEGPLEPPVIYPRVDLGGGDALVSKGGLDKPEVPGLPIEVHGEGVAQGVDGVLGVNPGISEPLLEAELDLAA